MIAAWLALACGSPEGLLHQESWELLLLTDDASVADLRLSRTHTGLLRGGGRVRLELASRRELPLGFGREGLPGEVERLDGGLRVGPDRLERTGATWSLRLEEGELDARLSLTPSLPAGAVPAVRWSSGRGEVEVQALLPHARAVGFLRAGFRDELVQADAVLIHRQGDDPPALRGTRRVALYAFAPGLSLGVDQLGGQALCWLWADGTPLPVTEASLIPTDSQHWTVDFGPGVPLRAGFRAQRRPRVEDPLDADYTRLERALLRAWRGEPVCQLAPGTLTLASPEGELRARALLLTVEYR